jgi:hypothetical protein
VSAVIANAQKKRSANRAQQVTLVAAIYDQDGSKILVKGDGLLPTKTITDQYREKV